MVLMDAVLHEFRIFDIYHRTAEVTLIHSKGLSSLSWNISMQDSIPWEDVRRIPPRLMETSGSILTQMNSF